MIAHDGDTEGLFHGAFMQSGSPIPVGDITLGQKYYDGIVLETGCSKALDTLACLRLVRYNELKAAIKSVSPGIFSYQVMVLFIILYIRTNYYSNSVPGSCLAASARWRIFNRQSPTVGFAK